MKKVTLRLDESLAKKLELLAKKEKRSINNYLVFLIELESEKKFRQEKIYLSISPNVKHN